MRSLKSKGKALFMVLLMQFGGIKTFAARTAPLIDEKGHAILQPMAPKLDESVHKPLTGKVSDWTFAELGIEYTVILPPPRYELAISKVRLGTWASRAGLRAGDAIFDVHVKDDAYLITVNRNGTTYRAKLSKLESKKLPIGAATTVVQPGTTKPRAIGNDYRPIKGSTYPLQTEKGTRLETEVNLAICFPEPKDAWGKGQWELLAKERLGKLTQEWDDWLDSLRAKIHSEWPRV